ncbi:MAG TPA: hypothetical protein VNA89_10370, partial [Gemmatimonadaceae bacterium]|nr:hypothetical protein [Gemmatimonadaceae bacterium]
MLLHDVEVVEQPFACGADVGFPVRRGGETRVGTVQDPPGAIEAHEQRRAPPPPAGRGQALLARDGASALGEVLGAQQLAADWSREQLVRPVRGRGEETC